MNFLSRQLSRLLFIQLLLMTITLRSYSLNCTAYVSPKTTAANALLEPSRLPHRAIPWDRIQLDHFIPAAKAFEREARAKIDRVFRDENAPTFENTILPLDGAMAKLGELFRTLFILAKTRNTEPKQIGATLKEIQDLLTDLSSQIYTNKTLYARVAEIYEKRGELSEPQRRLVETTHKGFVESGIHLPEAQQKRLVAIQKRMSELENDYNDRVAAYKSPENFLIVIRNRAELEGLPEAVIGKARDIATEQGVDGQAWAFTGSHAFLDIISRYAKNPNLRRAYWEKTFRMGSKPGSFDTRAIIIELMALRHEFASILGHKTYAHAAMEFTMAKTPERVMSFLRGLQDSLMERSEAEVEVMRQRKVEDTKIPNDKLMPWDAAYYKERIREERYAFDAKVLTEYFEFGKVFEGALKHANKLFGLEFAQRFDLPVYEPSVTVYEVSKDGRFVGLIYFDLLARPDQKTDGAWVFPARSQGRDAEDGGTPVVTLNMNIVPSKGGKTYLEADQVRTLFHELGHGLHELLSRVDFQSQAGTRTPRDFVELPSTLMEEFLFHPQTLDLFATNDAGRPIPRDLIAAMVRASKFGKAGEYMGMMEISLIDLQLHYSKGARGITTLEAFEAEVRRGIMRSYFRNLDEVPLLSTFVPHFVSGGYQSAFYGYLWSDRLAFDAFSAFRETGDLYDQATAARFQRLLSRGGSRDEWDTYIEFRGREPDDQAFVNSLLAE